MSSIYRVICLSHDPAIVLHDREPSSHVEAADFREEMLAGDHASCDLVVGRYSYPMIEVTCFETSRHVHREPKVWDSSVLALASAARTAGGLLMLLGQKVCAPCWSSPTRLVTLRNELSWVIEAASR